MGGNSGGFGGAVSQQAPATYCDPPDSPEPWSDHWGGLEAGLGILEVLEDLEV